MNVGGEALRSAGARRRLARSQRGVVTRPGEVWRMRWRIDAPPNNAIQRTAGAPRSQVKFLAVGGAPAAADGERWADEIKSERKTLKQGSRPRGLLSSLTPSSSAPRRWPSGSLRDGASPDQAARSASATQTVGMQHSGPYSCGTVRSAGADIRLGGLGSRRLQLTLGDMRGGMRLLLRRGVLSDGGSRC